MRLRDCPDSDDNESLLRFENDEDCENAEVRKPVTGNDCRWDC